MRKEELEKEQQTPLTSVVHKKEREKKKKERRKDLKLGGDNILS